MTLPPHAPYDLPVGHEVEVRVYEKDQEGSGILIAECEVGGDVFGAETTLDDSDLANTLAVDELVEGVCRLVYHELLGTPVFRDEDEKWTERVAARHSWEGEPRTPTLGYVAMPRLPEPDPEPEEDSVSRSLGDADVSDLRLTQDDMAALSRGVVPESLMARVLEARSTANLIETAYEAVRNAVIQFRDAEGFGADGLVRAEAELHEVLRRFAHE